MKKEKEDEDALSNLERIVAFLCVCREYVRLEKMAYLVVLCQFNCLSNIIVLMNWRVPEKSLTLGCSRGTVPAASAMKEIQL